MSASTTSGLPDVVSLDDFRVTRGKGRYCQHRSKVIDANARRLECADCEAPLDPFDALLDLARHHDIGYMHGPARQFAAASSTGRNLNWWRATGKRMGAPTDEPPTATQKSARPYRLFVDAANNRCRLGS